MLDFWQDPVNYAVPIFGILMGIEVYLSYREKRDLYEWRDSWASIGMGIGVVFVGLVMKTLAWSFYTWLYQYRLLTLDWHWLVWVAILFADDFTFYWHHRLSHEVRVFWAAHINHHSSQRYNLATALRQSWVEDVYKFVWWFWLPLLGFQPMMILMMQSLSLIYQFWIHTQLIDKLGFLEYFLNTPSHHRAHRDLALHERLDDRAGGRAVRLELGFGARVVGPQLDHRVHLERLGELDDRPGARPPARIDLEP